MNHQGALATVSLDYAEVHELSIEMLKILELSQVTVGTGASALALALGRVLSLTPMDEGEEIKFLQAALEWGGMYFSEGGVN